MKRLGKWIGAGLGWTIGGPIGALLGFAVGSFVDASGGQSFQKQETQTTTGDFVVSLLVIIASAMKADRKVMRSELDFVRKYLVQAFGEEKAGEMLIMLRDILHKEIPFSEVTQQIRSRMDYASRLQLMHLVYGISLADGGIGKDEILQIDRIALQLGVHVNDATSLKNMFIPSISWAYKVLETDPGASDEEIRKSYRRLAMKNHPDKVSYLGEEVHRLAQEKFQKISEAYETIKRERGL